MNSYKAHIKLYKSSNKTSKQPQYNQYGAKNQLIYIYRTYSEDIADKERRDNGARMGLRYGKT